MTLIVVRLVLALAAMISIWLSGGTEPLGPFYVTLVIVFVLTVVYAAAMRAKIYAAQVAFIQLVVDVGLETALVYHTGGVRSPFVPLYLVSIASGALVLSARAAIFLACQAAACVFIVTASYVFGFGGQAGKAYQTVSLSSLVSTHIVSLTSFFLVAILSGALSRRLAAVRILHEHILDGIDEGILVLDPELRVSYSNGEASRLIGIEGSIRGRAVGDMLGREVELACGRVLTGRCSAFVEISCRHRNGRRVPVRCRIVPLTQGRSSVTALILVLCDVTAERQAREALAQRERLEAVAEISTSIAHEIRNPLASIRGAVQEIGKSPENIPPERRELIEVILSESSRLDRIVSDFLDFARLRPTVRQRVRPARILNEAVMLLRARPDAERVRFSIECPEDLEGWMDPDQLRQVLMNLGANALDALASVPAGDRTIILRAFAASEPIDGRTGEEGSGRPFPGVVLEVSDTGPGMTEEVRLRAFDPFFTTRQGGTGLGLSIVARIVRGHGGNIQLLSRPEGGTTVRIFFPDAAEPAGRDVEPSEKAARSA
jgi:two-component system sensor histidine kinase PilS (NtrC family)